MKEPGSEILMHVLEDNLLVLVGEPSCNKRLLDIEVSEWLWISLDLCPRQQQEIDPCKLSKIILANGL